MKKKIYRLSINGKYDVYLDSKKCFIAIAGLLTNEAEYYKQVFSLAAKHFGGNIIEKKVSLNLKAYEKLGGLIYEIPRKPEKIMELFKEEIDNL